MTCLHSSQIRLNRFNLGFESVALMNAQVIDSPVTESFWLFHLNNGSFQKNPLSVDSNKNRFQDPFVTSAKM